MEAILGGESWKGNNSVVVGTVGWHGPEVLHLASINRTTGTTATTSKYFFFLSLHFRHR